MAYQPLRTLLLSSILMLVLGCWGIAGTAMAEGPSFDGDQASGSGSKYQGQNQTFWEHQGEVTISWGYSSPAMICANGPVCDGFLPLMNLRLAFVKRG